MGRLPKIRLQQEKAFPFAVNPSLVSYCPTMELLAVVSEDHHIEIWRTSGQRASIFKKDPRLPDATSLCWSPDGD
jgi:anaphase-promoting complex subunit 4